MPQLFSALRVLGRHTVIKSALVSQMVSSSQEFVRKCCNFESGDGSRFGIEVSCRHLEQPVDELNLAPHIRAAHPPRLPLPNHVHGLVALDCPPRRVKLAKPLFGLYPSFDRSMVLLQDIVQVLDRPMAAAAAQGAFLFHGWRGWEVPADRPVVATASSVSDPARQQAFGHAALRRSRTLPILAAVPPRGDVVDGAA